MSADQFTRWLCPSCGQDGFDSWNKAVFDGPTWEDEGELPSLAHPYMLGCECWRCDQDATIRYTSPGVPPRVIMAPEDHKPGQWMEFVESAFAEFNANPEAGVACLPAQTRDADWSRGCLAAKGQLQ